MIIVSTLWGVLMGIALAAVMDRPPSKRGDAYVVALLGYACSAVCMPLLFLIFWIGIFNTTIPDPTERFKFAFYPMLASTIACISTFCICYFCERVLRWRKLRP